MFLLSVRSGAVGINLTQANNVFLLEPVRWIRGSHEKDPLVRVASGRSSLVGSTTCRFASLFSLAPFSLPRCRRAPPVCVAVSCSSVRPRPLCPVWLFSCFPVRHTPLRGYLQLCQPPIALFPQHCFVRRSLSLSVSVSISLCPSASLSVCLSAFSVRVHGCLFMVVIVISC